MTREKRDRLRDLLRGMDSALLAYSGGVDSTFLLSVAQEVLGDRILAVTALSPIYPSSEVAEAKRLAKKMGVRHRLIENDAFSDPLFVRNDRRRCYHCKRALFARLHQIARQEGLGHVLDGSNHDDLSDDRPGTEAIRELGIRSPLQEVQLTKEEIRQLSREAGLETWRKPAMACLASRVPYGTPLREEDLRMIERAEEMIRGLGCRQVRVRHHGQLARIEVEREEMENVMAQRKAIVSALKKVGYLYVTLDLEGYRSGSMNEALAPE